MCNNIIVLYTFIIIKIIVLVILPVIILIKRKKEYCKILILVEVFLLAFFLLCNIFTINKCVYNSTPDGIKRTNIDTSEIKEKINEIEEMNEQLLNYLVKVATAEHSKSGEKSISKLHEMISDFNREIEIADNMLKYTKTVNDNQLTFSSAGIEQISNLMEKLMKQYYLIEELFHTKNNNLIEYIDEVEEEIDLFMNCHII